MKRGHAKHDRPVVADAGTVAAAVDMVVDVTVASEEATETRHGVGRKEVLYVGCLSGLSCREDLGRAGFEPAKA